MSNKCVEPFKIGIYMLKWFFISTVIGIIMGALSAFFLFSLDVVTNVRIAHSWLIYLLPVSGAFFAFLYLNYGRNSIRGNNLIIEQANGGDEGIPLRLIPLALFGTIITHLFGGSVGREGTAVQMGGAVASNLGCFLKLNKEEREIIIICGISAGFSSVFGTPLAGTIFALEVLVIGRIRSDALFPSFFAAFFANFITEIIGVTHTHYSLGEIPNWSVLVFVKLLIAGICFGLVGCMFSRSIVVLKKFYARWINNPVLRNFIGGAIVIIVALLLQTQRYLGLSLPLLEDAFKGTSHSFDFIGKLFFTVLSLGAGYQGGEVTPLFEIGATLGNTLAPFLHLSIPFVAGLGFIGVFSGATNTPIACSIMGIELFGGQAALYFCFICIISYICSGNTGIYSAQQVEIKKGVVVIPKFIKNNDRLNER